jgi:hypothetical protein
MRIVLTLAAGAVAIVQLQPHRDSLLIRWPQDGAFVSARDSVVGTVTGAADAVWVVVHPVTTSDFWVQPPVTVRGNGTWRVVAYFGRTGVDAGTVYEVRAFSGGREILQEGKRSAWPQVSGIKSDVVSVTRR